MEIEERKTEMEVGDCSLWHYLIFCEEFVSDACKNNFVCWVCKESVLGHPTFKCLECGFVQHKSCSKLLDLTKMDVECDITKRHHLLLREEMVNNGKEEAVCRGCGKLAFGPTYRCSVPQCTFHLHKLCDQLSHVIQHIVHPDHTLLLRLPSSTVYCDLCGRYRKKDPLLYACRICDFDVDIKCLPRWDIIESERKMEAEDCSLWHYLIFCEELVSDGCKNDVVCWVCNNSISGYAAFKCLDCSFVQHKSCSQLPDLAGMDFNHDITDRHHLILREEKEDDDKKKVVCARCGKLASSLAYGCSIPDCVFYLHKSCDQLSHAILHNAHPDHTLILALPPLDYYCDVCDNDRKKRRTTLAYSCGLCNFVIDNQCASRWDIIQSERKMETEDCSKWHYLIFCEEFVSDDCKYDVICWVCEELVVGHPTFKCLECSFVQHKSCTQLLNLTGMGVKHDITCRHHLILREEMDNNDKNEVFCLGCGEIAYGAAYRCSIPKCTLHLHTECHCLPCVIQHIAHRKHPLFLTLLESRIFCDLCGEHKYNMIYECPLCIFKMDMKCTVPETIDDDCDQHSFIAGRKLIKFTCDACGEETEDVACQCSSCRVFCHLYCTHYPRIIKIRRHHHLFSRTYCLHQVKNLENVLCKLCCRKVNTKCGAYYCQVCDYIIHMKCAKKVQDMSTTSSKVTEFDDYTRHLVYLVDRLNTEEDKMVIAPSKIHHFSHPQHELILLHEDRMCDKRLSKNDKQCEACMRFIIFSPFYGCEECNIFFHKRCAEVPETIWRMPLSIRKSTLSFHTLSFSSISLMLKSTCTHQKSICSWE